MSINMLEKSIKYFNECNLEKLTDCFHKDIIFYNLADNSILMKGIKNCTEALRKNTADKDFMWSVENSLKFGNIEIVYSSSGPNKNKVVVIAEIEDGLIKNVWEAF